MHKESTDEVHTIQFITNLSLICQSIKLLRFEKQKKDKNPKITY